MVILKPEGRHKHYVDGVLSAKLLNNGTPNNNWRWRRGKRKRARAQGETGK